LAKKDGVETINIVRREEQVKHLKEELGAKYVLDQTSATFFQDLAQAIKEL